MKTVKSVVFVFFDNRHEAVVSMGCHSQSVEDIIDAVMAVMARKLYTMEIGVHGGNMGMYRRFTVEELNVMTREVLVDNIKGLCDDFDEEKNNPSEHD